MKENDLTKNNSTVDLNKNTYVYQLDNSHNKQWKECVLPRTQLLIMMCRKESYVLIKESLHIAGSCKSIIRSEFVVHLCLNVSDMWIYK